MLQLVSTRILLVMCKIPVRPISRRLKILYMTFIGIAYVLLAACIVAYYFVVVDLMNIYKNLTATMISMGVVAFVGIGSQLLMFNAGLRMARTIPIFFFYFAGLLVSVPIWIIIGTIFTTYSRSFTTDAPTIIFLGAVVLDGALVLWVGFGMVNP